MTASTTSCNACTDPYNEDLQADQLTLSISVHRAAAPEAPSASRSRQRAESDAAARDEGERACYNIATPTEHLTISSATQNNSWLVA